MSRLLVPLLPRTGSYGWAVFFPLFRARLTAALAAVPTRTLGLSINYLSQALCAFAIIGFLKAVRPELRVVLGGSLITSWVAEGSLLAAERFGGLIEQTILDQKRPRPTSARPPARPVTRGASPNVRITGTLAAHHSRASAPHRGRRIPFLGARGVFEDPALFALNRPQAQRDRQHKTKDSSSSKHK